MTPRAAFLRLGGSLLALVAGAAGVVVVVALLRSEPGPVGSSTAVAATAASPTDSTLAGGRVPTPTDPAFPSPPPGAIVFAQEAGSDALGLAIVPGAGRSLVRVSVVGPAGPGASGLDVAVSLGGRTPVALVPCGAGCYQAELPTGGLRLLSVELNGHRYPFALPAESRPADGAALVRRASAVWKSLKTLVWHERLAGSPTDVLHTVYEAVAPDELRYTIAGLSAAVIIGGTRWDRSTPTGKWEKSIQDPPIQVPVPFWYSSSDAHVLGSAVFAGHDVWTVSFFDPTTPAWFQAEIDKRSDRTLELSMTAASHFMHHVYVSFNVPLRLSPPAPG